MPHLPKRPDYAPGVELIASKRFLCAGVAYRPGQPFDADSVNERRLRQLYDARMVSAAPRKSEAPSMPRRRRGRR